MLEEIKKNSILLRLNDYFSSAELYAIVEHYPLLKKDIKPIVKSILFFSSKQEFSKIEDFKLSLILRNGEVFLKLHNVSASVAFSEKILKHKEIQIISTIRDLSFAISYKNENQTEYTLNFSKNASLLEMEDEISNTYGRVMVQGGHSITDREKEHHREIGFYLGIYGLEIITGSGNGAMKSPFKGAILAYGLNHFQNKKLIGLTEKEILKTEKANPYCNKFVVFPKIENRMEAFIRLSKGGFIFPGGFGTLEEILTFLSIKLDPKNKDNFNYPIFFTEPKGLLFFKKIVYFLSLAIGEDILKLKDFYFYENDLAIERGKYSVYNCVLDFYNCLLDAKKKNIEKAQEKVQIYSNVWNYDLFVPSKFQKTVPMNQTYFDEIHLDFNLPIETILWNIRSICYLIIEASIRQPDFIKKYPLIKIRANKKLAQTFDDILESFIQKGRLGKNPSKPYIFI